jgi:tetratricopeptide (TPR) repeat protein
MVSRCKLGRLCAVIALLALAGPAWADSKTEARDRLDEGSALYRKGDYQGALRRFEEAHALYPSPKIFFNLGQALNRLGRTAAAVDAFERFLAEAPDAVPERRRDAEQLLKELRPRVGFLRVTAAPGSEIAVDGQTTGTAPLKRTIPVDPGTHQVTARAPGAPIGHVGSIAVAAGETTEWEAKEAPAPLPDVPAPLPAAPVAEHAPGVSAPAAAVTETGPAPAAERTRWWPWALGGAAVAAGVVLTAVLLSGGAKNPDGSLGHLDRR